MVYGVETQHGWGCSTGPLFTSVGNGWSHNALHYYQLVQLAATSEIVKRVWSRVWRHRHECKSQYPYTGSKKHKFACIPVAAVHIDMSSVRVYGLPVFIWAFSVQVVFLSNPLWNEWQLIKPCIDVVVYDVTGCCRPTVSPPPCHLRPSDKKRLAAINAAKQAAAEQRAANERIKLLTVSSDWVFAWTRSLKQ